MSAAHAHRPPEKIAARVHIPSFGPRFVAVALVTLAVAFAHAASPQTNPPGYTPTPAPGAATGSPLPAPSPPPLPAGSAPPAPLTAPTETPPAPPGASGIPAPSATPTQPPIVVEPPSLGVEPGKVVSARVNRALGTIAVSVADATIASAAADQVQRKIFVTGLKLGRTLVTVKDDRGETRDVPVLVAYAAGTVAENIDLKITGNPASAAFVRDAAIVAAVDAAQRRSGARTDVYPDDVHVRGDVRADATTDVDVPVVISGDGYFTVNGVTRVHVTDVALPPIVPSQLLVSDYPERLTADGVLFNAQLDRSAAQRFLYYHFNPGTEKPRRILLKVRNTSAQPATLQIIAGRGGPGTNEMEVGHNSTKAFLIRQQRNEGNVVTIPGNATVNALNADVPTNAVVSGLLQLREVNGDPLDLTLVAQGADAPLDQSPETTVLLSGGAAHARGAYPVPTFSFDDTYTVGADPLEIPIGQLPLPNMRVGEALSGDYGVEQRIRVVFVNPTRGPQPVAIYANPRGGRATGTFIVNDTLVQAHALAPFSRYKIWQETIGPNVYRTVTIVTMPEGGSSYPLRLVFGPDDGSVSPGAPGSPIY